MDTVRSGAGERPPPSWRGYWGASEKKKRGAGGQTSPKVRGRAPMSPQRSQERTDQVAPNCEELSW